MTADVFATSGRAHCGTVRLATQETTFLSWSRGVAARGGVLSACFLRIRVLPCWMGVFGVWVRGRVSARSACLRSLPMLASFLGQSS